MVSGGVKTSGRTWGNNLLKKTRIHSTGEFYGGSMCKPTGKLEKKKTLRVI